MSTIHHDAKGAFQRRDSQFRNFIKKGDDVFPPEKGRYHIYISLACPWAHRTYIFRALKGLEDIIGLSIVDYFMGEKGWKFSDPKETPDCIPDTVYGSQYVRELYHKVQSDYAGPYTVPILWDTKNHTIVNNESSEIIRMLNTEFNEFSSHPELDMYPEELRTEIDDINAIVYPNVNNGVYRCGFAKAQSAYEEAFTNLFKTLDTLEERLSKSRYLVGSRFTEADVRLFTTLIRFDVVYVGHFKCNKKLLREYPNLHAYMTELYQMPAIKPTVNFTHIKNHYHQSHNSINPFRITPLGPDLSLLKLDAPHGREKIGH